jgi:hypothetical protein
MLGYLWFLYHNREVSYRAALNLTVSRRQNTLYATRGFDVRKWEALIEEANTLRKEIKNVANEYDVEWDEKEDEGSEEVGPTFLLSLLRRSNVVVWAVANWCQCRFMMR